MVLKMLEAISKAQMYFENDLLIDYDIERFIFIHVARVTDFQGDYECYSHRRFEDYFESPGVLREQHTHRQHQEELIS